MTRSPLRSFLLRPSALLAYALLLSFATTGCDQPTAPPPHTPPAPPEVEAQPKASLGALEGTFGNLPITIPLNTHETQLSITSWEGLKHAEEPESDASLSIEAFLFGSDAWKGPARRLTIEHQNTDASLQLHVEFVGVLAIDQSLRALPAATLTLNGTTWHPQASGSWTAENGAVLPTYQLELKVKRYTPKTGALTGSVNGRFIDPTAPEQNPRDLAANFTIYPAAKPTPILLPEPPPAPEPTPGPVPEPTPENTREEAPVRVVVPKIAPFNDVDPNPAPTPEPTSDNAPENKPQPAPGPAAESNTNPAT